MRSTEIIGSGDIASVIPMTDGIGEDSVCFFASGVSNSQCTDEREFQREVDLLLKQDPWRRIIYFSSLSIFYKTSPYTQHKLRMERLVKSFEKWTIIRLGNISWGKNPHTLINYLRAHPDAKLEDTHRYVINLDEFLHWINMIPNWNCEMNLTGRFLTVQEIYDQYVR